MQQFEKRMRQFEKRIKWETLDNMKVIQNIKGRRKWNFLHIILIILITSILSYSSYGNESLDNYKEYKDSSSHFLVQIPAGWKIYGEVKNNPNIKLCFYSPDKHSFVYIYVYALDKKYNVNLKKSANLHTNLFKDLGVLVNTKKNYKWQFPKLPFLITEIESDYKSKDFYTKLLSQAQFNMYYILMYRSLDNNAAQFYSIFKSFKTSFTKSNLFKRAAKSQLPDVVEKIIVPILLLLTLLPFFGLGYVIKIGVVKKRFLLAGFFLVFTIALCITLYVFLYLKLSHKAFLWSLLVLPMICLAVFGSYKRDIGVFDKLFDQ